MNPVGGMADIFTTEMAEFSQAETGSVKHGESQFCFWIFQGVYKNLYLSSGRDKRKEDVELLKGNLRLIPGFMQNIDMEELKIGNDHVNSAVGKSALFLDPGQIIPHDLPGSIVRGNPESFQVCKIRVYIRFI